MAVVWGRLGVSILVALLLSISLASFYSTAQAQMDKKVFKAEQVFSIPESNGSIRFSVNGSYDSVTSNNGFRNFTNLRLGNSQYLANVSLGVKDSNITIHSLRTFNFTGRGSYLRYTANGIGIQSINFGEYERKTRSLEWSVTVPTNNGIPGTGWLSEGQNWNLLADNTVVIRGLTGNVSVMHYNFIIQSDSNLPFYQQHSIFFITVSALAVAIMISVAVKVRRSL